MAKGNYTPFNDKGCYIYLKCKNCLRKLAFRLAPTLALFVGYGNKSTSPVSKRCESFILRFSSVSETLSETFPVGLFQ